MKAFDLFVLGCGSAFPTIRHNSSAQVLCHSNREFLIDCGEGTQQFFCRSGLKFSRLRHIFISHLHGDHCLGLVGL
ncbi:MAG: MBL fold metallo-hydrolase, partial [Porphyromonadaceae bacterium]|nr:MBL fold metallo-hydrolase [Porphyromonadaceae bacterium]